MAVRHDQLHVAETLVVFPSKFSVSQYVITATSYCAILFGPNRYIGLLIFLADISLSQIYLYRRICSLMCTDIKTVSVGLKKYLD